MVVYNNGDNDYELELLHNFKYLIQKYLNEHPDENGNTGTVYQLSTLSGGSSSMSITGDDSSSSTKTLNTKVSSDSSLLFDTNSQLGNRALIPWKIQFPLVRNVTPT